MTTLISKDALDQIASAYRRMSAAGYRPAAPSDELGHITVPLDQLNLDDETVHYAARYWRDEDRMDYFIGCPNWSEREAFVLTLEAARAFCGAERELGIRLLQAALDALEVNDAD